MEVQQAQLLLFPSHSLTSPAGYPITYQNSTKTSTQDGYGQNQTHFQFTWPPQVNGIERVVLSAKGDLQRVLSAYFGSPITVTSQFQSSSLPTSSAASPTSPIIQDRRVNLVCASRVVCVATSTVTLLQPSAASLILDQKYAIGQTYRVLGLTPEFELVSVKLDLGVDGKERVTRRYRLIAGPMECDIEEVFPDRAMFREEQWLYSTTDSRR